MDVKPYHLMSVAELWTMTHTNREVFSFHLTCMNIMSSHCIAGLWLRSKRSGSCYAFSNLCRNAYHFPTLTWQVQRCNPTKKRVVHQQRSRWFWLEHWQGTPSPSSSLFFSVWTWGMGMFLNLLHSKNLKKNSSVYLISSLTIINQSLSHHYLIIENYIISHCHPLFRGHLVRKLPSYGRMSMASFVIRSTTKVATAFRRWEH